MRALVIVAHGSRREASNEEVILLSETLRTRLSEQYPLLNTGFLELAKPSIPDSIIECIEKGATEVNVLPYFLSAGRHVQEDVPNEINKVKALYPQITINRLSYIGGIPQLLDLLCDYVTTQSE